MTYNEAVQAMNIETPPRLRQLTDALEALMAEDVLIGQPFVAARVVSRTTGMPGAGFFETAKALGMPCANEAAFHAWTLQQLDQGRLPAP